MKNKIKQVFVPIRKLTDTEIAEHLEPKLAKISSAVSIQLRPKKCQKVKVKDQSVQTDLDAFEVVKALQAYIHYCCDQCEYKCKEGSDFKSHLDDNHNEIKEDLIDDNLDNVGFEDSFEHDFTAAETIIEEKQEAKVEMSEEVNCLKCQVSFENESKLIEHITDHHHFVDIWDVFTCQDYVSESCQFTSTDLEQVKEHVKNHFKAKTEEKTKNEVIDNEDTPLIQKKKKIKKKIKEKENVKKPVKKIKLKCVKCDQIFKPIEEYLNHIESEHLKDQDPDQDIHCQDLFQYEKGCQFSTANAKILVEHITVHCGGKPKSRQKHQWKFDGLKFFCQPCDSDFKLASLTLHLTGGSHAKQSEFQCKDHFNNENLKDYDCNKIFLSSSDLIQHIKSSHVDPHVQGLKFRCDKCDAIFDKVLYLQRHNKHVHLGIPKNNSRPSKAKKDKKSSTKENSTCSICQKTFYSKSTLESHIIAIHDKVKPYVCEQCGKAFTRPALLTQHKKKVHDKVVCRTCEFCGKAFNFLDAYKRHIEAKHTEGFAWQCEHCPYAAKTKHNLRMHTEGTHATELKYPCDYEGCQEVFTAFTFLKNHKKRHIKESMNYDPKKYPFACPECPQRFQLNRSRQQHIKITHRSQCDRKCPLCERMFNSSVAISKHLAMTHPDYDKYFCTLCSDKFYCASKLKSHQKTIHGEKSVDCHICGKSFVSSSSIKLHMIKTHHDDSFRMPPRRKSDLSESNSIECHLCGRRIHLQSINLHMIRVHKDETYRKSPKLPPKIKHQTDPLNLNFAPQQSLNIYR